MKPIPSEWLQPGAIVPVDAETVRELLECVRVAYRCGQEAEREACARVCEERSMVKGGEVFAARIRARGQA